ncbi:MAG: sugar ABC transporter ATP-binding protein [Victivallaceae bacterium]|nr:sugar ABC transporter ATP-binding protein [Victivallaceae bacterium]
MADETLVPVMSVSVAYQKTNPSGSAGDYVLEARGICKTFSGASALKDVDFRLRRGEIHALMGANGAGKSTLIDILTGVSRPDGGEIFLDGEKVFFRSVNDARRRSISAIYQNGAAFLHLNVTENIFAGHGVTTALGLLNWRAMHARAEELLRRLGCSIDPRRPMGDLTPGERQVVEIAKALSAQSRILIMDEPTAALSWRESMELYDIVRRLRADGCSIIFVSHRLEDIRALTDRITVLRDGECVGTWDTAGIGESELLTAMAGRRMDTVYPRRTRRIGEELLRIDGFTRAGYFKDVSLTLRRGEILGLAGLVGAGRTEVMRCVFGIDRADRGDVFLNGRRLRISCARDAMDAGIGYLPENRLAEGLLPEWGIGENISIGELRRFTRASFISQTKERIRSAELASAVGVKAKSIFDSVRSLSGGNQQKVVFAKIRNSDLEVLILDEPTKGVDVGAKSQIYEMISSFAARGFGVIMVSSELSEVLGMSDTVAVMRDGVVSAVFDNDGSLSQKTILKAAMPV